MWNSRYVAKSGGERHLVASSRQINHFPFVYTREYTILASPAAEGIGEQEIPPLHIAIVLFVARKDAFTI